MPFRKTAPFDSKGAARAASGGFKNGWFPEKELIIFIIHPNPPYSKEGTHLPGVSWWGAVTIRLKQTTLFYPKDGMINKLCS